MSSRVQRATGIKQPHSLHITAVPCWFCMCMFPAGNDWITEYGGRVLQLREAKLMRTVRACCWLCAYSARKIVIVEQLIHAYHKCIHTCIHTDDGYEHACKAYIQVLNVTFDGYYVTLLNRIPRRKPRIYFQQAVGTYAWTQGCRNNWAWNTTTGKFHLLAWSRCTRYHRLVGFLSWSLCVLAGITWLVDS